MNPRLLGTGCVAVACALAVVVPTTQALADEPSPAGAPAIDATEAAQQAAALADEDHRLTEIRTVTSLARWQGKNWKTPYRLGTAAGYTLVLTPRAEPYTVADLLELAPQTFVVMTDGAYLLSEHIVVMARATLDLSAPGGLMLRLASGPDGFATIVSFGGELLISGTEAAPATVSSWDVRAADVDDQTTDGRAYIRAVGGQFVASHAVFADLGFWSGRSGGLALTGTDRPNTGAIESLGPTDHIEASPRTLIDNVTWQEAGPLEEGQTNVNLGYTVPSVDYVSGLLDNVTVERNAFGLFVSGANGIQVSDSTFADNELGGVVLHRFVTNGVIARSDSTGNGGDGFTLARATTGIVISESSAANNSGSGFSLDGRALADGPSVTGASLAAFGNNSVSNSTASDNGGYGIEVLGGFNIGIQNNRIEHHDMGIVVRGESAKVAITGNTIEDTDRHGIALVDGVTESTVTGNVIDNVRTGVYLRASSGEVRGNTIEGAGSHGVSLVGAVDGTTVSYNVLSGSGESAFDQHRADGTTIVEGNNADAWHDTTPWYFWFKKLLQPMSALWSALAILILLSAVRSRRKYGAIEHPYAHQMAHHGHLPMPDPRTHVAADQPDLYEHV